MAIDTEDSNMTNSDPELTSDLRPGATGVGSGATPPQRPQRPMFEDPTPPPASAKLAPRQIWLGTSANPTDPTGKSPNLAATTSPTRPLPGVGTDYVAPNAPARMGRATSFAQAPRPTESTRQFGVTAPPVLGVPKAASPDPEKKRVGWFWPSIAAFIVGGLLVGLGFRIGTQANQTVEASVTTPVATTAAPAITVLPPVDAGGDPATFVASTIGPSVVTVETDRGLGSGVIFDDGLVMTNNHVIEGARTIFVRLADGALLNADLVGADPRTDIAVLDVGQGRNLPIAELALGVDLEVGQLAIAIGSPFELQQTVTAGIISALNRPIQNGLGYSAMIQTDAPINPGNSGGALADRRGRVIGINTAIQTAGEAANAGVGFAVPIDTAYRVASRIIADEPLVGGFLGIGGAESTSGSSGLEVGNITDGSGAEIAGIRTGDRIISIDGAPVVNLEQLAGIVSTKFPGDEVEIGLVRNGETLTITATLGER